MSTPYTPIGGTQAVEFAYDDDEHGQGLVTLAGVMLTDPARITMRTFTGGRANAAAGVWVAA